MSAEVPGAQGFANPASVEPGDRLALHIRSSAPIAVEWYRLGWYRGEGGRLVRRDRIGAPVVAGPVVEDAALGRTEAQWDPALTIEIPADWLSGRYVAVLRPETGGPTFVPFVVRSPLAAAAPVLVVSAFATWHAYDSWGGKSLYGYQSTGDQTTAGIRAAEVSFDRPFARDLGAGMLRMWELQFVRWLERHDHDADHMTDIDLALRPEAVAGRRLLVLQGHPEYWSRAMRETVQGAVDAGTNVAFLCANEVYWAVRLGDSPLGPLRRVTCYKNARFDPLAKTDPRSATVRWREAPLLEPEARLIGQMYGHVVGRPGDWVVRSSRHWLYHGTGLRDGDRISRLVGQEYDTFFPDLAPPGTELLARGPVDATGGQPDQPGDLPSPPIHTATIYTAPSGATVLGAGTFQWSWALDDYGKRAWRGEVTPVDPRVGRMTANLIDRLGRE